MSKRESRLVSAVASCSVLVAVCLWPLAGAARAAEGAADEEPAAQPAKAGAAAGEQFPVVLYTKENAPPTPKLEDLPQKESVSRDGITWTFEKPARAGRFVNGGWYVVGPVTIVKIDPAPLYGEEVKDVQEWEKDTRKLPGGKYIRNGSMLNPPAKLHFSAFDTRIANPGWSHPDAAAHLPIAMKPGDSLMSSIGKKTVKKGGYVVQSFSVLTCLKDPVPADAFRPGYSDPEKTIYLARNLRRELLPNLAVPKLETPKGEKEAAVPDANRLLKSFDRPWHHQSLLEDAEADYQFGGYGRGICQQYGNATLLLCLEGKAAEKEKLLVALVEHGLDLWGICKNDGYPGWPTLGGWGSGRKWPMVFAGLMLGDERMAAPTKTYPRLVFQEDNQCLYDDCWTGADVMYGGHDGWRPVEKRPLAWGPYENLHPSRWMGWIGTSYRTNMTSSTWIGEALAIRFFRAEKEWNYDAFLDYCDRWMYEPDCGYRNPTRISIQGSGYDLFQEAMWKTYRQKLPAVPGRDAAQRPIDGWKKTRELKGPAVEVAKGRITVKGQPFFPILLFAETDDRIADAVAIGADVLAEGSFEKPETFAAYWKKNLHNDKFLDELAAKGLYGVFGADARTIGHPALLGWIHVDEPDQAIGKKPDELKNAMPNFRVVRAARFAEDEKTPLPEPQEANTDASVSLVGPAYRWMKKMDKGRPVFLTVGPSFFTMTEKDKTLAAEYLANCEAVGCKMPLVSTGDSVKRLRELAGPDKMIFAWIETKGAKPEEVRAAVIAAIKNGAAGIGYRGFEGFGGEKPDAAVMGELKKINGLIATKSAELLADPSKAETLLK